MPKARPPADPARPAAPKAIEDERTALLSTLQKLGFALSRLDRGEVAGKLQADLWVRPPGTTSQLAPVFVDSRSAESVESRADRLVARWSQGFDPLPTRERGASILVVESDQVAELTGQKLVASSPVPLPEAVARTRILVQPSRSSQPEAHPHWHRIRVPPRTVLMIATGILVGLAEKAQKAQSSGEEGSGVPIDVEGMFRELRRTFNLDVEGSLGVTREEDAMFLLYQLALRETYAPGDQGASLHELVNDPKGPAARLPWFAI